jgi:hypothetical protein
VICEYSRLKLPDCLPLSTKSTRNHAVLCVFVICSLNTVKRSNLMRTVEHDTRPDSKRNYSPQGEHNAYRRLTKGWDPHIFTICLYVSSRGDSAVTRGFPKSRTNYHHHHHHFSYPLRRVEYFPYCPPNKTRNKIQCSFC